MPHTYLRCQVTIPMTSGLPADSAVNVWSFQNAEPAASAAADAAVLLTWLDGFYTAQAGLFSSKCNLAGTTLKVFDMADSKPRVPVLETTMPISGGITGGMDFPPEVAICLSFKAAPLSGHNARRERGRIYLGPLQQLSTIEQDVVAAAVITGIMSAVAANIVQDESPIKWAVYSPYEHHNVPVGTKLDPDVHEEDASHLLPAFTNVASYWIDNAWDTQRRRGVRALNRITFP